MIFSKLILPFLTVSSVAAVGFVVKTNGAGVQVASEETANQLFSEYYRRQLAVESAAGSIRKLPKSGKTTKKSKRSVPEFIYEQDDDDMVLELANGKVLEFDSPNDDEVAICTKTMCFGSVEAVLPGYRENRADFLAVHLSSSMGHTVMELRDWEFICPSALQVASIVSQECYCAQPTTNTGSCAFEQLEAKGSSLRVISAAMDVCGDGVRGSILIKCVTEDGNNLG